MKTTAGNPDEDDDALDGAPAEGSHRVRLVVRVTALEPGGVRLDAGDFRISGLGRGAIPAALGSHRLPRTCSRARRSARRWSSNFPDKAVALVLDGPGGSRLSLGLAHHTP